MMILHLHPHLHPLFSYRVFYIFAGQLPFYYYYSPYSEDGEDVYITYTYGILGGCSPCKSI